MQHLEDEVEVLQVIVDTVRGGGRLARIHAHRLDMKLGGGLVKLDTLKSSAKWLILGRRGEREDERLASQSLQETGEVRRRPGEARRRPGESGDVMAGK